MRRPFRLLALPLVLLLPSCSPSATNPFVGITPATPPPSDADIGYTSNTWSQDPSAGRELFSVKIDGSEVTRLTFYNNTQTSDIVEGAFAPEKLRAAIRVALSGSTVTDLQFIDLSTGGNLELVPASQPTTSIDWAKPMDELLYAGEPSVGASDNLFVSNVLRPPANSPADLTCVSGVPEGEPSSVLTCDPTLSERRARFDTLAENAVFERSIDGGNSDIYVFESFSVKNLVAAGAPPTQSLPGTPYFVGGNADPAFSPDETSVVFRTLTGLGNGTLGTWNLNVIVLGATSSQTIVSGPSYRGAPDWGLQGIVFTELDPTTNLYSLVVVQSDGSGRTVVLTAPAGFILSNPRWLR